MLGENIKTLRKKKGYSQETFAQQLNVVRQTVSKWEKGYSVPDAEMLRKISDLLEVPVNILLGADIKETGTDGGDGENEIAKQLAVLNEQLADRSIKRRRIIKRIIIGIVLVVILTIAAWAIASSLYSFIPEAKETTQSEDVLSFTDSNDSVVFQGKRYEKIDLSAETLEWIVWYNSLSKEEQLSVSSIPEELQSLDHPEDAEVLETDDPE